MAQGILPYKYEEERNEVGMTAMAGLPIYLDLAWVLGVGGLYPGSRACKEIGSGVDRRAGRALFDIAESGGGRLCG